MTKQDKVMSLEQYQHRVKVQNSQIYSLRKERKDLKAEIILLTKQLEEKDYMLSRIMDEDNLRKPIGNHLDAYKQLYEEMKVVNKRLVAERDVLYTKAKHLENKHLGTPSLEEVFGSGVTLETPITPIGDKKLLPFVSVISLVVNNAEISQEVKGLVLRDMGDKVLFLLVPDSEFTRLIGFKLFNIRKDNITAVHNSFKGKVYNFFKRLF